MTNSNNIKTSKFPNTTGIFISLLLTAIRQWIKSFRDGFKTPDEKEYQYWVDNGGERIKMVESARTVKSEAEETKEKLFAFRERFKDLVENEKKDLGTETEKGRGTVITGVPPIIDKEEIKRVLEVKEIDNDSEGGKGLVTLEASKIARIMMHERRYVSKGRSYWLQVSATYIMLTEKEHEDMKEVDYVQSMVKSIMGEKGSINELDHIWLKDGLKKAIAKYNNFVLASARGNRMRNLFVLEIGGLFKVFGVVYVMISRNKVGLLYKDVEGEKELYSVEYVRNWEYNVMVYVLLVLLSYVMWEESGRGQGLWGFSRA